MEKYCSWCFQKTNHKLYEKNYITRNIYICENCLNHTLECRWCDNMAMGKPNIDTINNLDRDFADTIGDKWDNELCAEHDGTIASFKNLSMQLDDIKDFGKIFERNSLNLGRIGKISAITLGTAAVFTPVAFLSAPALASALGTAGLLGAASTGTAISTLSGAALTSASLAAIGGGSMLTGTVFVAATGLALGGYKGAVIGNSYFGEIENFKIIKKNEGKTNHNIIYINGFLSQEEENFEDWIDNINEEFLDSACYGVTWESKNKYELGSSFTKDLSGKVAFEFAKKYAQRSSKNPNILLKVVNSISDLISNPWHSAMVKSVMTGILIADLISRTKDQTFTLMGHSLGCRVIYYILETLGTRNKKFIKDVYLLGGAVDRNDIRGWEKAVESVQGKIYNCYSKNDNILKYLYKGANLKFSDPIGSGEIKFKSPHISNFDCSEIIDGHMKWKKNFDKVLNIISKSKNKA